MPTEINPMGTLLWRRPTLARPIAVLPSGLQRFTSVFGMGTGGATALLSPEPRSAYAARLWCVIRHFQRAADSLASTYRKKNVIRDSSHRDIGFSDYDSRLNDSRNSKALFLC